AKQKQLWRKLREGAHWDQAGEGLAMLDRIAQRDDAAETDAGEEDRPVAELLDQKPQHRDMIVLADEECRLVGLALAQKVERHGAEILRHQRVAIGGPELRILGQPVDENVGRSRFRPA